MPYSCCCTVRRQGRARRGAARTAPLFALREVRLLCAAATYLDKAPPTHPLESVWPIATAQPIHVRPTITSVVVQVCNLPAGHTLFWLNGSRWAAVSGQVYNASTGCITAILTGISVLSVTQLAGTPFAVVMLPPPTVTSLVGPAAPVAVRTAATATIGFADDSGADAGPYTVAVWDKASGQVVYDTQPGAANGADPVTALTGGAVQIHRR